MKRPIALRPLHLRGVALLGLLAFGCNSSSGGNDGPTTRITSANAELIAARVVTATLGALDAGQIASRSSEGGSGVRPPDAAPAVASKDVYGDAEQRGEAREVVTRDEPTDNARACTNSGFLVVTGDFRFPNGDFPLEGDFMRVSYGEDPPGMGCDDNRGFEVTGVLEQDVEALSSGLAGMSFDVTYDARYMGYRIEGFQEFSTDPPIPESDPPPPSLLTDPVTLNGSSVLILDLSGVGANEPDSVLEMFGSGLEVGRDGPVGGVTSEGLAFFDLTLIEDDVMVECETVVVPDGFRRVYDLEIDGTLGSSEFAGQVVFRTVVPLTGVDDTPPDPDVTSPITEGCRDNINDPVGRYLFLPDAGELRIEGSGNTSVTLDADFGDEDQIQLEVDTDGDGTPDDTILTTWPDLLEEVSLP